MTSITFDPDLASSRGGSVAADQRVFLQLVPSFRFHGTGKSSEPGGAKQFGGCARPVLLRSAGFSPFLRLGREIRAKARTTNEE